jgi:hypothetical protein
LSGVVVLEEPPPDISCCYSQGSKSPLPWGDYTMYVNWQIAALNYAADCILNFNETNIDFDPSLGSTKSKVGESSISICILGHSGRCTVMLGCTVSGFKFPAIVIWKGVPNGRIDQETNGQHYLHCSTKGVGG